MAYQKVGTPRFYIDMFQYLKSLNVDLSFNNTNYKDLYNLDPVIPIDIEDNGIIVSIGESAPLIHEIKRLITPNKAYFAILNHNMESSSSTMYLSNPDDISSTFDNREDILNASDIGGETIPVLTSKDGCTIMTGDVTSWSFPEAEETSIYNKINFQAYNVSSLHIGAISVGSYYDMPVSPNLNLTMNIEFDGFDNSKALNGATSTNAIYQGSPWWYDKDGNKVEPWAIGESNAISKRNGRRVWNLSFSYMSDKDLFASNYGSSTYLEDGSHVGYHGEDVNPYYGQNMFTNPTFDSNIDDWSSYNSGTVSHNTDTDFTRTGAGSLKITYDGTDHWGGKYNANGDASLTATSGTHVKASGYVYFPTGQSVNMQNGFYFTHGTSVAGNPAQTSVKADTSIKDTWQYFETTFQMESDDSFSLWFTGSGSYAAEGSYLYVDDVEVVFSNPSDFQYTIDDDDSFSAQVLNKISHSQKFIFQPDNTNNNPDQFAICVLDQDSFSMKRTAWNVYDISMKIKEVW